MNEDILAAFDKRFAPVESDGFHYDSSHLLTKEGCEEIKQFIVEVLAARDDELRKNVGMMRQWLNEDRITDPKKMVDNKDLLHWLSPTIIE